MQFCILLNVFQLTFGAYFFLALANSTVPATVPTYVPVQVRTILTTNSMQLVNQIEQQAKHIKSGTSEIFLVNIYIPPGSCCISGYQATINHLPHFRDCLLLGHFNAHHALWHSNLNADSPIDDLADEIVNSNFWCFKRTDT